MTNRTSVALLVFFALGVGYIGGRYDGENYAKRHLREAERHFGCTVQQTTPSGECP